MRRGGGLIDCERLPEMVGVFFGLPHLPKLVSQKI